MYYPTSRDWIPTYDLPTSRVIEKPKEIGNIYSSDPPKLIFDFGNFIPIGNVSVSSLDEFRTEGFTMNDAEYVHMTLYFFEEKWHLFLNASMTLKEAIDSFEVFERQQGMRLFSSSKYFLDAMRHAVSLLPENTLLLKATINDKRLYHSFVSCYCIHPEVIPLDDTSPAPDSRVFYTKKDVMIPWEINTTRRFPAHISEVPKFGDKDFGRLPKKPSWFF